MSTLAQKKMMAMYFQMGMPLFFLMSLFTARPENFFDGESVEIDIVRSGEDVSVAIQDLSLGYNLNSADVSTNKEFVPPVHKEAIPINSFSLLKRDPGQNPFENKSYRAKLLQKVFNGTRKVSDKIFRSMEWQASQVLQTGVVALTDENGDSTYSIDYKPKATHFPTSGTAWGTGGATVAGDIISLCEVIRDDGLMEVDQLIMGQAAWEAAITDADFKARFETRRMDIGTIAPMRKNSQGGLFRGTFEVGNYKVDIWTYNNRYKNPQTGVSTPFVDPAKVIMRASAGRLDASFGNIPNIGEILGVQNQRVLRTIPRLRSTNNMADLHVNAWLSNNGEQLTAGVDSRPLMIPTAIDTYGCLDTGATL